MSVQFGTWNRDGKPIDRHFLEKVKPVLAPYGPDDGRLYAKANMGILYCAFHTTKESRCEVQPHITASGDVITWDGRLDNRAELVRRLGDAVTIHSADVLIVAAAYQQWGVDCFAQLLGDWALSIWDARAHSLILAKDPIGTRQLHYSIDKDLVTWSTILDPLVLFRGEPLALCEEYIAGWFSFFPATHLTPYVGIHSVPPSSYVTVQAGKHTICKYWEFDPGQRIHYSTDAQYEEHFREVFAEAIRRRLRSEGPVLAELSGGMDSSSIVCMADTLLAGGTVETPRLDTVSYYDDSEPNWDEKPYFSKVEEKRGRTGRHIDVKSQAFFRFRWQDAPWAMTPTSARVPSETDRQLAGCMNSQGNRVVLSGTGGDEATGGVPTPTPELQDFLASGQFRMLAQQLKLWALAKRRPWFHLLFDSMRGFLPVSLFGVSKHLQAAAWLDRNFARRNRAALLGYQSRVKLLGPRPSVQENIATLEMIQRQLACCQLPSHPAYEKRYPYLDRSLLEFLYAVPRGQLVRPGERRSLMRRSLGGIVPEEILNRKRKAYIARLPMVEISKEWERIAEFSRNMASISLGIVEPRRFSAVLDRARQGHDVPLAFLSRTLMVEQWLRNLQRVQGSTQSAFLFCGRGIGPD
ncbi:MAG: asparagine synthase-related protein [Candidatus Acidiferrales bacterium]|jgi:asparagine synthase (glutamine-hydrolysing)